MHVEMLIHLSILDRSVSSHTRLPGHTESSKHARHRITVSSLNGSGTVRVKDDKGPLA